MGSAPPTCAVQPCTVPVHKVVDGARRVITQVLGLRANGEPRTWSVFAAGGGGRGQPRSWNLLGFCRGSTVGKPSRAGRQAGFRRRRLAFINLDASDVMNSCYSSCMYLLMAPRPARNYTAKCRLRQPVVGRPLCVMLE